MSLQDKVSIIKKELSLFMLIFFRFFNQQNALHKVMCNDHGEEIRVSNVCQVHLFGEFDAEDSNLGQSFQSFRCNHSDCIGRRSTG